MTLAEAKATLANKLRSAALTYALDYAANEQSYREGLIRCQEAHGLAVSAALDNYERECEESTS